MNKFKKITFDGQKGETTGKIYYLFNYNPLCLVMLEGEETIMFIEKKYLTFIDE